MFIPSASAIFLSNMMAKSSFQNSWIEAKVAVKRIVRHRRSSLVMETTLPQRTLATSLERPTWGERVRKMKAKAMFRGKAMLVTRSTGIRALSATGPMRRAVAAEKSRAVKRGFIEIATPKAAPAKAPWDMEYPIAESLILATNTPIKPVRRPDRIQAMRALCMKASSSHIIVPHAS